MPSRLHYAFINCCLAFIAFVSTTFLSNLTGWDPHFGIGWHSKYDIRVVADTSVSASLSFLSHIFHSFHYFHSSLVFCHCAFSMQLYCPKLHALQICLLLLLLLSWSTKGPKRSKFFTGKGPRQLKGRNRGPLIFAAFYKGPRCRISYLFVVWQKFIFRSAFPLWRVPVDVFFRIINVRK